MSFDVWKPIVKDLIAAVKWINGGPIKSFNVVYSALAGFSCLLIGHTWSTFTTTYPYIKATIKVVIIIITIAVIIIFIVLVILSTNHRHHQQCHRRHHQRCRLSLSLSSSFYLDICIAPCRKLAKSVSLWLK